MTESDKSKSPTPAYGSFKTFVAFANDVREGGHVPLQVDRTLMPKLSGSAASETIATLRFLAMVSGEKAVPTQTFEKYVMSPDGERKDVLADIVRNSYSFLFTASGFDIERASGQQVADLFRAQGINGSTLVRAISFFLAAAKEAGIKVSHNVKPPKSASTGTRPKKEKKLEIPAPNNPGQAKTDQPPPPGVHRFELPIPGKPSVQVLVPDSLDGEDWNMLAQMFGLYVNRWKGYTAPAAATGKAKETPE